MSIEIGTDRSKRKRRQEDIHARLLEAAVDVVGENGYSASGVARITAAAGVAHGTFYNYFESQQDIFDQLLPYLGERLLKQIREAVSDERNFWRREEIGFRAFFEFVQNCPQFYRILNEGETFAPSGYKRHLDNMIEGYTRAIRRGVREGEIRPLHEQEIEALVLILLAARNYLCMRYAFLRPLPDFVARSYLNLVRRGLQSGDGGELASFDSPLPPPQRALDSTPLIRDLAPQGRRGREWLFEGVLVSGVYDGNILNFSAIAADFAFGIQTFMSQTREDLVIFDLSVSLVSGEAAPLSRIQGVMVSVGSGTWSLQIEILDSKHGVASARATCHMALK